MNLYTFLMIAAAAQLSAATVQTARASSAADSIEIVVFSDFQCPFCRKIAQPIRELQAKGVEGVSTTVTFRDFPLPFHADSQLAHQAAFAAREQGKFWEMHDLIFANQTAIKRDDLLRYAGQLGLNMERFRRDLDSDQARQAIGQDKAEGTRLGVNGTPTLFIGGKEYSGAKSYDELKQLIQGEQRRKQAIAEVAPATMSKGAADAPVTLEFFADLESPVSRSASYVLDELMGRYPAKIRIQFRNFPLAFHPQAALAHESAMAAARQGHFWEMANYIFDHQEGLREQDLLAFAGSLRLDESGLAGAIGQHRYAARVDADVAEGFKRGVHGSPVIFVNDKRIDGVPSLEMLERYVETELAGRRASR